MKFYLYIIKQCKLCFKTKKAREPYEEEWDSNTVGSGFSMIDPNWSSSEEGAQYRVYRTNTV